MGIHVQIDRMADVVRWLCRRGIQRSIEARVRMLCDVMIILDEMQGSSRAREEVCLLCTVRLKYK